MDINISILSVGGMSGYATSNTCLHRTWALEAYPAKVDSIDTRSVANNGKYRLANKLFNFYFPVKLPDLSKANQKILEMMSANQYNILWIDKGITINKETLIKAKELCPSVKIIGYSPDEMTKRHNQSQNFLYSLPYYDYYITTKSHAIENLKKMGCKNVIFIDNAYEDTFHYMHKLSGNDKKRLGADVGFIGAWEAERANSILFLAQNGINVRVWGDSKWQHYKNKYPHLTIENGGLFSEDYPKALSVFRISLCFLRKINHDQQTTRSVEIPACGGFMLAERTSEHMRLFAEGKEADFFSTNEELLEKCKYYLEHDAIRKEIAASGHQRCIESGYSNKARIKSILDDILQ